VGERTVEEEILGAEREWLDAIRGKDAARCERILAPEYTLFTVGPWGAGHLPRARWLEVLRDYDLAEARFDEHRVLSFGDVAVFQARYWQRATVRGADRSGEMLLTDVWVRKGGSWQVVARQTTPSPGA
jgi:ketosteroid isomerase-like protein